MPLRDCWLLSAFCEMATFWKKFKVRKRGTRLVSVSVAERPQLTLFPILEG